MPTNPHRLVTLTDPRSPMAEAYRTLRTNLMFSGLDHPLTTFLVTSAAAEEGKSTTLANLAVTLAQGGRTVILVDCDLRRPHQHEIFGVPVATGSERSRSSTRSTRPLWRPPRSKVSPLLPAGESPPSPADLLGSRRMEHIIANLQVRAPILSCSTRRPSSPSPTRPCWPPSSMACCWWSALARPAASTPSRPKPCSKKSTCASSARC